jgi:predicted site-specific integrase-resolvase
MQKDDDLLSETITDAEIAQVYDVSESTVRRWGRLGLLPPKIGPGRQPRRNREAVRRKLSGIAAILVMLVTLLATAIA